mgnify:CR=1 FL=1|tara:strand:- start:2724 stop:3167 length:444 start_codon:yes stop_codon:yes gene_type:complete
MSYKNYSAYTARFIQLTLSSDQTITGTSVTTVNFDTITGDSGHGVSVSSNLITLSANKHYWGFGVVVINRNNTTDSHLTEFYNSSNIELTESDGFFSATVPATNDFDSRVFQISISPSSSTSFYIKSKSAAGNIQSAGTHFILIEMS